MQACDVRLRNNLFTAINRKMDAGMIGVNEAAKMLKVSARQVRKLITSGTLIAGKIGRDYVIRRADLAKVPKDRKPGRPKKDRS